MYLFVFIFVLMSVLGLYTELFSLRMSHILKNQRAAAETMMLWHGAAHYMVKDYLSGWTIPPGGCSVTDGTKLCGATATTLTAALMVSKYLPPGYAMDTETQFDTAIYETAAGQKLLVTYVKPTDTKLGFTNVQIHQQMVKARLQEVYFGYVGVGSCNGSAPSTFLITNTYVNAVQICYPAITKDNTLAVPVGAVGIISIL